MLTNIDWIFFDCFNTLIDDFDANGEESRLGTLPEVAVGLGFFSAPEEFTAAYNRVRAETVQLGSEILLQERLKRTLEIGRQDLRAEVRTAAITQMVGIWEEEYRRSLRLTPGVVEMLQYWSARRLLGVVANFFLPGRPAKFLQEFGLHGYFRFVLDSAAFGYKKPSPLLFMESLSRAGLGMDESGRVLAIGDRYDLDIAPAHELGMPVLHFTRMRIRPNAAPTPEGIPVIYDWSEFR